jgi:hypothetical protein
LAVNQVLWVRGFESLHSHSNLYGGKMKYAIDAEAKIYGFFIEVDP